MASLASIASQSLNPLRDLQSANQRQASVRSAAPTSEPEFSPPQRQSVSQASQEPQRPETDPEKRRKKKGKDDRPHLNQKQKTTRDVVDSLYENIGDVAPRNAVGLALMRGVAGARLGSMVGESILKGRHDKAMAAAEKAKPSGGQNLSDAVAKTVSERPPRKRRRRPESEDEDVE